MDRTGGGVEKRGVVAWRGWLSEQRKRAVTTTPGAMLFSRPGSQAIAAEAVAVKHGRDPVKMRVGLLGVALGAAIVEGATDAQIRAFCETTLRTLRSSQHMGELQAALEARRTRVDS